ncbi:MAG: formate dehydrogenase accessory sulfurtransferase FdhD [Bacteroidota bacterium]
MKQAPVQKIQLTRTQQGQTNKVADLLVVEAPLEIRLAGPAGPFQSWTVSMRTPGQDMELAAGLLYHESVIQQLEDIILIDFCQNVSRPEAVGNVLNVRLAFSPPESTRRIQSTASCGVCGKASIEAALACQTQLIRQDIPLLDADWIIRIPDMVQKAQTLFAHTGGIHAAALFAPNGEVLMLREDIGRHNALDKLVAAALGKNVSLTTSVLFLSGRVGFELVQKSLVAGIPAIVAVGAPSSLAVEMSRTAGQQLIGFVREDRFNHYT